MFGLGKKKQTSTIENFEIPSFPGTVLNLLTKLRDPDISINELAHELEIDPGLHIRVLKTVNSASFGLSNKVSNIAHAVNLLGRSRLESLVLTVATKESLTKNNQAPWLDMNLFWATAARRAAVARGLAVELHPHVQSDVFTIALLEDIGVPILANREGDRYRDIYSNWQLEEDFDLIAQEQLHCGIDHATLGAQMAKAWGFPESLYEAIGQHHQPDADDLPLSLKIAALVKAPGDGEEYQLIADKAEQLFGIDSGQISGLIENVLQESQELAVALS
jgi:HD-like signal output (HDOD) protein